MKNYQGLDLFRIYLSLGILGVSVIISHAQQIIYSDSTYHYFPYNQDTMSGIGTIELGNCTDAVFDPLYAAYITDLVYSNITPLCFGLSEGVPRFYEPDLVGGLINGVVYYQDPFVQGMTCDYYGHFYAAGRGLTLTGEDYIYEPPLYLGDFPAGMECGGDLTYRDGKLYMVTKNNELVLVDIQNPGESQVIATFPNDILPIEGLVTFFPTCDSVVTYAFGMTPLVQKVYILDFTDYSLSEYCDFNVHLLGTTSFEECVPPDCIQYVDLDYNNSSGVSDFDFQADTFCLGIQQICDDDVLIFSEIDKIDSMTVQLSGILDAGQETLQIGNIPAAITVSGNNTPMIKLFNAGLATFSDFEMALKAITFQNASPDPQNGIREVAINFYTWVRPSVTSICVLPLFDEVIQLQIAIDTVQCFGQQNGAITIQNISGGLEPYSIEWGSGSTNWQIENLPVGAYSLEVTDFIGCKRALEVEIPQPAPLLLQLLNSGPPWVCDTFGLINASAQGGNGGYSYLWNTGAGGAQQTGLPPGLYEATVTDSKGCTAEASVSLEEMSYQSADTAVICQGESYPFEGQLFFSDTSWCQTLLTAGGCDSLRCLELTVRDTFFSLETAQICAGQAYAFQGQSFAADTFFCAVFSSQHGCDSTVCLSLEVIDTPNAWTVSGTLCNGQPATLSPSAGFAQYQWSNGSDQPQLQVFEGGWYFVTLTDGAGCVKTDSVWVEDESFEVLPQSSAPSCPGLADGMIDVGAIAGGAAPFSFSVNGGAWQAESQFVSLPPGGYTVAVQDAKGCLWTEDLYLSAPPPFWVSLGPDQSVAFGEPVTIGVTASDLLALLSWLPPAPCADCWELTYQPLVTETLSVALISASGCQAADTVQIEVRQPDQWLYLPNIFSPNADGVNDAWEAHAGPAVRQFLSLKVFSRWGDQVYTREGPAQRMVWDGTSQGKPLPAGVYVCLLEYELISGERRTEAAQVTVVR
jgi:gliding motility-associated-like protein